MREGEGGCGCCGSYGPGWELGGGREGGGGLGGGGG